MQGGMMRDAERYTGPTFMLNQANPLEPVLMQKKFYCHYAVKKISSKGTVMRAERVLVVGHLIMFQVNVSDRTVSNVIPIQRVKSIKFKRSCTPTPQLLVHTTDKQCPDMHVVLIQSTKNMPPSMPPQEVAKCIQFAHHCVTGRVVPLMNLSAEQNILEGAHKAKPPGHSTKGLVDTWRDTKSPDSPFRRDLVSSARAGPFAHKDTVDLNIRRLNPQGPLGLSLGKSLFVNKDPDPASPFEQAGGTHVRGWYLAAADGKKVYNLAEAQGQLSGKTDVTLSFTKQPPPPPLPSPEPVPEPTPEQVPVVATPELQPEKQLPRIEVEAQPPPVQTKDAELQVGGGDLFALTREGAAEKSASPPRQREKKARAKEVSSEPASPRGAVAQDILAHTLARDLVAHTQSMQQSMMQPQPADSLLAGPLPPAFPGAWQAYPSAQAARAGQMRMPVPPEPPRPLQLQLQLRLLQTQEREAGGSPDVSRKRSQQQQQQQLLLLPQPAHHTPEAVAPGRPSYSPAPAVPVGHARPGSEDPVFEHQLVHSPSPAPSWAGGMGVAAQPYRPQWLAGPALAQPPQPPGLGLQSGRLVVP